MRRFHLIELHEQNWVPKWMRREFVETLGVVLKITGVYSGVGPLYAEWLQKSGGREILDLASGAAGPTGDLIADLHSRGIEPPAYYLSDLFPIEEDFALVAHANPQHVSYIKEPVDALHVEPPYGQQLRQIVSAFHHFNPEQARKIIRDAVEHSQGICILEPFQRSPLHLLIAVMGIFPALIAPFFTRKWRALHFFASLIIPIIPLMMVFDGVVSVLRIYTRQEIEEMIAKSTGRNFRWVIDSTSFMGVFHTTCVFGWQETGNQDK